MKHNKLQNIHGRHETHTITSPPLSSSNGGEHTENAV